MTMVKTHLRQDSITGIAHDPIINILPTGCNEILYRSDSMIQRTRAQRIFEKMFRHTACTLQRLTRVFAWMILRRWDEGTNKYLVDHCWLNFLGLVDLWLTKKNNNKNTSAVCGFNRSVDMYSTAVQPAWTVRAFSNYFPRDLTTNWLGGSR